MKFLLGTLRPGAMYTYGRLAAGLQVMKDEAGDLEFKSQCSAFRFATHRNREGGTRLPDDHVPAGDSVLMARLDVLENPPPHHVLGTVLDFPITLGAEPLAADTPDRVLALFAGVATEDPDPVVQAAARYLHTGLLRRRALR